MTALRDHPRYRLLIFDWDGTLLDSIGNIVTCTQRALAELELPAAAESDLRAAIGMGIREMVDRFYPGCSETDFLRLVEAYRRLWFETYCHRSALLPGAEETLRALRATGYWLAIATAKSRRGLNIDLERTGIGNLFLASRTADEAQPKPHPEMVLSILDELGVPQSEVLVIGDTSHDLEMARNAATDGLGVTSGSQSADELARSEPRATLDGVWRLGAWLASG